MHRWVIGLLVLSGILGFSLSLYHRHQKTVAISSPVIQTFHYPTTFVNQLKGDPEAGKKIFNEFCVSCHSPTPVIPLHAPPISDQMTWKAYQQLGMDYLLKLTIEGVGAMPARGGCFECSDDQLKETIQYILDTTLKTK